MKNVKVRHQLAVIPALILWGLSLLFFIIGFGFKDQSGYMLYVGAALGFALTCIQWIGWDTERADLGSILYYSWIMSYILGISTNMIALLLILPLEQINPILEWLIAGSLSFLIEVTPERLFVLAWRSMFPKKDGSNSGSVHQGGESRRDKHSGIRELGETPRGMRRGDYVRSKANKPKGQPQGQGQRNLSRELQQRFPATRASREDEVSELFGEPTEEDEFVV